MEAVAILGLASNVLQFTQFALGLLNTASTIHQSVTGSGAQSETLENVYGRLSQFSRELDVGSKDSDNPRSRYDGELVKLAIGCEAKCQELLQLVGKLKVAPAGKRKAWKSLRAALLTVCHQDDFRRLEREIDGYQKTMALLFSAHINDKTSAISSQLQQLQQEAAKSQDTLLDQLHNLQLSLVKAEQMKEQAVLDSLDYQDRQLREETIKDAYKATFEWIYADTSAQETGAERHRFLNWLEKRDGYFWINGKPGAGKSTLMKFLTADERTHTALKAWAHPSEAVIASHYFWSSGSEVQRSYDGMLRSLLIDIFSQVPEVISPVCRNEPWWSNRRAERLGNGKITPKWSISSLTNCLQRLATLDTLPTDARFCLFIDGLDEYDGADEDSLEMCETLLGLTTSPRLKICFSSRPSNVFNRCFGADPSRTLQVHELTAGDIERYTRDKIRDLDWDHYVEDNHVGALSPDTSPREHLINQFVESVRTQAEGVFLWVMLVVRLVRNGLTNFDSLTDLRQYIRSLPSDIKIFYWRILDGIDVQYHQKMSEYFEIALHCYGERWQVDIMLFAMYAHDSTLPRMPQRRWTESEYWRVLASIKHQLHAATGGLLEIGTEKSTSAFLGPRVNFLHSTARSFLQSDEVEDYLSSNGRDRFDPGHAFFTSFLSLCEHLPPAILVENGKLRASQLFALASWLRMNVCGTAWFKEQQRNEFLTRTYLDRLEKALLDVAALCGDVSVDAPARAPVIDYSLCWEDRERIQRDLDMRYRFWASPDDAGTAFYASRPLIQRFAQDILKSSPVDAFSSILRAAILRAGIPEYLAAKLDENPQYFRGFPMSPLKFAACKFQLGQSSQFWVGPVLKILLEHGFDPNEVRDDMDNTTPAEVLQSPWEIFLTNTIVAHWDVAAVASGAISLFWSFGADPNVQTGKRYSRQRITSWISFFLMVFEEPDLCELMNDERYDEFLDALFGAGPDLKLLLVELKYKLPDWGQSNAEVERIGTSGWEDLKALLHCLGKRHHRLGGTTPSKGYLERTSRLLCLLAQAEKRTCGRFLPWEDIIPLLKIIYPPQDLQPLLNTLAIDVFEPTSCETSIKGGNYGDTATVINEGVGDGCLGCKRFFATTGSMFVGRCIRFNDVVTTKGVGTAKVTIPDRLEFIWTLDMRIPLNRPRIYGRK